MRVKYPLVLLLCFGMTGVSHARTLLSEPVSTSGRLTFDANFYVSFRQDTFGTPQTKYQSVRFPWQARIGVTPKLDVGLMMDYLSQTLEQNGVSYKGSSNDLLSIFFKYNPVDNVGFMVYWHTKHAESDDQELPVARGDDIEALALYSIPTAWPITLNAGYVMRDPYNSKFGIDAGEVTRVRPGDITELKSSLEIPLPAYFSILSELAYYHVAKETLGDVGIQGSAGDALDALIGLSWDYRAWYLSGGASFGLLNESHTSFDLSRGAGDVTYHLRIGYKTIPTQGDAMNSVTKRFLFVALGLFAISGCHKDSLGKKIIDGLPVSTMPLTVAPAEATQQYLLLNNTGINLAIMNLNRLSANLPPQGISGSSSLNYTAQISESHYGSATFTLQFQDVNNTVIDPFSTALATASVQYVHIIVAAASTSFPTITENLLLRLDTVGILTGPYHMTGTAQFDGSSYSILYTIDPNSVQTTITGLLRGQATADTAGSPKPTSSSLSFGLNGDLSGTMQVDGQTNGIYVAANGSGFITTPDSRILFQ